MQFTASMLALAASLSWGSVFAAPIAEPRIETNTLARRGLTSWQIQNKCSETIYYTSVNQQATIETGSIAAGTTKYGSYAENLDGLSVKLCRTQGCSNPYQFETTVDESMSQISYDLSAIDGNPFNDIPNGVYTSDNSGPKFWCEVGSAGCAFTSPESGPVGAGGITASVIAQFCA